MSAIETASPRASWSASETAPRISEDWLSVIIGLVIFVLALAVLANVDLIGWVVLERFCRRGALGGVRGVWRMLEVGGVAVCSYSPSLGKPWLFVPIHVS